MKSVVSSVPLLEDRLSEENFVFTSSEGVVDVSASLLSLDAVLSKKDDSSSFSEMNDLVDATFRNITSSAVTCGGTTVVNLEDDLKDTTFDHTQQLNSEHIFNGVDDYATLEFQAQEDDKEFSRKCECIQCCKFLNPADADLPCPCGNGKWLSKFCLHSENICNLCGLDQICDCSV